MKATCKNSADLEQKTTTKIVTYPLLSLASSVTVGMGVKMSCARDVLSMDCGRMSNEAEYMNLDVENKTSKVETCIVDLFIKAAENRQFGMPNS